MIVLSNFDGMSCFLQALKNKGIQVDEYFASEIDEDSIKVSKSNHPEVKHVGDITLLDGWDFRFITLFLFGSPCQNVSKAGRKLGFRTVCGIKVKSLKQYLDLKSKGYKFIGESYLFWEAVRLLHEINSYRFILGLEPVRFVMENVGMSKEWEDVITKALGVKPILINASLLSAQNRERNFWTNIQNVCIPEDKHVYLSDVIPGAVSGAGVRGRKLKGSLVSSNILTKRKDRKANCLTTNGGGITKKTGKPHGCSLYVDVNGNVIPLTVEQMEQLQGLPIGYTLGVPKTHRIKMIGNGMSIPVIEYISGFLVPMYHNHLT